MKQLIRKCIYSLGIADWVHSRYVRWKHAVDFRTRSRNTTLQKTGVADGLPVPSPELVFLVTGQLGIEYFLENGRLGAECIRSVLAKNGIDLGRTSTVLDFGCGCGRVLRHLKTARIPKLHGVDYNPDLIRWCKASLPFAEFHTNTLSSGLGFFAADTFDLIYSISVFTHLPEDLQHFWMSELTRVLRPGGTFLFTVQGRSRLHQLTPEERQEFERGRCVVVGKEYPGKNVCSTFHPEEYVRTVLAKHLVMIDFVPGGAKDANQDILLFRKRSDST